MFFNDEAVPSLDTVHLIEEWLILRCYNIPIEAATSYVKRNHWLRQLEYFDKDNYKKVIEEWNN